MSQIGASYIEHGQPCMVACLRYLVDHVASFIDNGHSMSNEGTEELRPITPYLLGAIQPSTPSVASLLSPMHSIGSTPVIASPSAATPAGGSRWNRITRDTFGEWDIGSELSHDVLPAAGLPRPLTSTTTGGVATSSSEGQAQSNGYEEKRRRDEPIQPCPRLSAATWAINGHVRL
jgi:hypothetical protein